MGKGMINFAESIPVHSHIQDAAAGESITGDAVGGVPIKSLFKGINIAVGYGGFHHAPFG
jgi:hypothetical protein